MENNLHWSCINKEIKLVFTPNVMVSFRRAHKLSSYQLKTKLHPVQNNVG